LQAETASRFSKYWTIAIGMGLALLPIHNRWLTLFATNEKGETLFFLPAFGYLVLIMGAGLFILNNWSLVRKVGLGPRKIYIPLIVIAMGISLSGITAEGVQSKIAPFGAAVSLIAVYIVARVIGTRLFYPVAIGVVVASLGIILHQFILPGVATGGYVFEYNFDAATGYILLGAAVFIHKWRWMLVCLAIVAMLISGAPEAMMALAVLGAMALIRRDWSWKIMAVIVPIGIFIIVIFTLGYGGGLYRYLAQTLNNAPVAYYTMPSNGNIIEVSPLAIRWLAIRDAMICLKPLGEGYNLTGFTIATVHNVPLIIVQQLGFVGIIAGLAWLFVSFWGLMKTNMKYVWVLIVTLSMFDHYVWTQLAPWWWAVVGISTQKESKSDSVFRG